MAAAAKPPVWRQMPATPAPAETSQQGVPVLIVGAGPVGLALALDLGLRGHKIVVLNRLDCVTAGSKAICFAKRSLDIFDRLGVGDAIAGKGVVWNEGKVFWGADPDPVYSFDVLPVKDQKRPGFVNIQQYHVETALIEAIALLPNVELRWGHAVEAVEATTCGARVKVATGSGEYWIDTAWLLACDGCKSTVRTLLKLDFEGRLFEDNFLIADIRMKKDFPAERWFWFDPPFNPGQSALLHKQPDDVWRLDFQLGWNIDREACTRPENVAPLVRAMLGEAVVFEPVWYSVYTFQCRRMARFVHDRVVFLGDSAHLVSPFGARGCNGGLADIDNFAWKLDLVLKGLAPAALIETYNDEAIVTADENIAHSTASTDFLTPKSAVSRAFRDAVLDLARTYDFARQLVNSGRLSTAVAYPNTALNTPDCDGWACGVRPGYAAVDAPLGSRWLLERLQGEFTLLASDWEGPVPQGVDFIDVTPEDAMLRARYGLIPGAAYLVRPDQYIAGRWRRAGSAAVSRALDRAKGQPG
jgi:3-(3-hydroxy-phenyl)propionate hydroxylase